MRKRTKKILIMIGCDILGLGLLLVGFCYFHHGRIEPIQPVALEHHTENTPEPVLTPEPALTPEPTPEPADELKNDDAETETAEEAEPTAEPTPEPTGLLMGKYAEKFSDTVQIGEGTYSSKNISIEIKTIEEYKSKIHIADVYLNDIKCYRTGVYDMYSRHYMPTLEMSRAAGAILAISGDHFYAHRAAGTFAIRNGMKYTDKPNNKQDICVLFWDGVMETYKAGAFDAEEILKREPYQVWYFGPAMLDEKGKAYEKYASTVSDVNPRSAIGYYEPGHYCLVMAEGRKKDSVGITLTELGKVFEELGCTCAYNLDGGETAAMTFNGEQWSRLIGSGRDVSDIVYIAETGE